MILHLYFTLRRALFLAGMLAVCTTAAGQSMVVVGADQNEKLEVTVNDDLFVKRDNTFFFGESVVITGGKGPYSFTWSKEGTIIGNSLLLELPVQTTKGVYALQVTDAANCRITLVTTNSGEELAAGRRISLYPIPAASTITVDPGDITEPLELTFINNSGVALLKKVVKGVTAIDLTIPPGIYYVRIASESGQPVEWRVITVTR